jgi:Dehydrogenases with different specificities (related to short-chain alcohol dehydrogenases)
MRAIVTGASRGIGLAVSEALLKEGTAVLAVARSRNGNTDALQEKYGERYSFIQADISDRADRDRILIEAGPISLLVNNAGVAPKTRKDMLEISEDDYDYLMDINLKGTYFLTQAAAKIMAAQKFGRIVNIGSISSFTPSVNRAEYCLSKAGVSMATKLFAARMAEYGVGVFEISPGIIETDMTAGVKEKYVKMLEEGLAPIKRMGTPEDVAKIVAALDSGAFDFCTGTVIQADGGFAVRPL